ncbi:citrate lyase acyl carrier protein [Clostridium sp. UBA5119]|uniref:citrate lyase acyl carrier protein n=1 Tax=Clostridium sp. UBA5119 TaxID=1946366 RepID=UPI003217CB98
MEINKISKAGTLESNDIYVIIMPNEEGGIAIELESLVMKQFGAEIERAIREALDTLQVKNAIVKAQDKGALDYTIRARIETAVKRAQ